MRSIRREIVRTFAWLIISLLSGVFNVAFMPTRLPPNQTLELKHAALWLWLYLTGPLMYLSLVLGMLWFLIVIQRSVKKQEKG